VDRIKDLRFPVRRQPSPRTGSRDICNLYTARQSPAEVAAYFAAKVPAAFNTPDEVVPGYPGMVVREQSGERILQSMTWGFPLPLKSKRTGLPIKPKPVNNIADLTSGMWRNLAPRPSARCLIPVTEFAEAEGEKGSKTRTWFRVKGQPIFAWAGLWRDSAEWGHVYSGLMTDCNEAIRPVHNRMPVLLHADEHDKWLHGPMEDVIAFQFRCFPDELIEMERTSEPWIRREPRLLV
jgi:putative SOS response-associated peptidase YedK